MTTMGFYEARTHLSELLDEVAKGKKILITRRGRPAALIGPPPLENRRDRVRSLKRRWRSATVRGQPWAAGDASRTDQRRAALGGCAVHCSSDTACRDGRRHWSRPELPIAPVANASPTAANPQCPLVPRRRSDCPARVRLSGSVAEACPASPNPL